MNVQAPRKNCLACFVLCVLAATGCQDMPYTGAIPPLEQSQDKPYARKTTETNADGVEVPVGSSGTEAANVKPPMHVHTGVYIKTDLKKSANADLLNPQTNKYPDPKYKRPLAYSISYSGPCNPAKWLQFVWKTHYYDGDSTKLARGTYPHPPIHNDKGGSPGKAGGTGSYVTDPTLTDPKTHLDTPAPDSPYYNAEGAHSDDDRTMYDAPRPGDNTDGTHFGNAETVVYHFTAFLICGGTITYHLSYTVTFQREPRHDEFGDGKLDVQDSGAGGGLSDKQKEELKGRFPTAPEAQ
jgi:hypothetical protein